MTIQHTPGPWSHSDFELSPDHHDSVDITAGECCEQIAVVVGIGSNRERNANVRIIQAAPEMLKACQAAFEFLELLGKTESVAGGLLQAALDKANEVIQ